MPTEGADWGMARFHVGDEGFNLENYYPDSMVWVATGADRMVNAQILMEFTHFDIPAYFEL